MKDLLKIKDMQTVFHKNFGKGQLVSDDNRPLAKFILDLDYKFLQ